jgi:hypothetical protein
MGVPRSIRTGEEVQDRNQDSGVCEEEVHMPGLGPVSSFYYENPMLKLTHY